MRLLKIAPLVIGLSITMAQDVNAGVAGDLDHFFNNLGYESNTTSPAAYESQAAGSYGSGSLYVRNQVKEYRLIQLDLPSYKAGCGGIDLYMGSLSFLKGERLKDLGKAVMSNAGAYAFDVALATTVPELKQIKDNLQELEQKMNNANINSCQLAKNLVGGIWPKTEASQKKICEDQGTMGDSGLFGDFASARQGCSGRGPRGDEYEQAMDKASQDPAQKETMVYNKNIVWALLKDKSSIFNDKDADEIAELAMSLTGTIIVDKKGKVTQVPSLINNQRLIQALLGRDDGNSEQAMIWRCDDRVNCMKVSQQTLNIPAASTFRYRVSSLIESLYKDIKEDKEPSIAEKNLVAMSHVPIFKFLTVIAATDYGINAVDLNDYSALIAQEVLSQYLKNLLQEVRSVTVNSKIPEAITKRLESQTREALVRVNNLTPEIGHKLDEKLKLVKRIQSIEKLIAINAQENMG